MRIALFQPEIAGNVGTIIRLGACFGMAVDIIEPCGFPYSDRALARAGMDYREHANVTRHPDWDTFKTSAGSRLVLFTTKALVPCNRFNFQADDTLLFGNESSGVPDYVRQYCESSVTIPLVEGARSINLAVAAGIGLFEALRQTGQFGA